MKFPTMKVKKPIKFYILRKYLCNYVFNLRSESKNQKSLQKLIMPSLNRKNHFNSLKTMYADCVSGVNTKKKFSKENISEKYLKKQKVDEEELEREKK